MNIKNGQIALILILVASLCYSNTLFSQWDKLKKYSQDEMQVLKETQRHIVFFHKARKDTIIVCSKNKDNNFKADIYTSAAQERGGNPYQIWVATERFWYNSNRPRNEWGDYFKGQFLRIIRPPERHKDNSD